MKIYVPMTGTRAGEALHAWAELEAERCRILGGFIYCDGTIYGQIAYTDLEGVRLYWNKEEWKAVAYRYEVIA